MEFFRVKKDIPFMKYSRISAVISTTAFILAIFFIIFRGLNLGVDFTGGTMMEVSYPEAANIENIRETLRDIDLEDTQVQNFGTEEDVLIRLPIRENLSISENDNLTFYFKKKPSNQSRCIELSKPLPTIKKNSKIF